MRLVLIIGTLTLTLATVFFANRSLSSVVAGDEATENAITALAEQVTVLKGQILELEAANQVQAARIEALTTDKASLTAETDEVANQLALATQIIDDANRALRDEQGKAQALEADLRRVQTEKDLIEEQLAAINTTAPEATAASDTDMSELEERMAEMGTALEAAKQEITTLQAEAEAHAALVAGFTDEAAAADAEIAALQSEIAVLIEVAEEGDEHAEEVISEALPTDIPTLSSCTALTTAAFADQKITFERGTSTIAVASRPALEQLVSDFQACADANLMIEIGAHTDSQGGELSNQKLSEDRARAVLDFLYAGGVPSVAMRAVGYGESIPIADNSTSEGRSQNRRITFEWQQR